MTRTVALLTIALTATALSAELPASREPKPEPAAQAILSAFDAYQVVGMNVYHRFKDIDDFILSLVRQPEFPQRVNDIVVEGMNSQYQSLLDRYIAGENVTLNEVRQLWRSSGVQVGGIHDQLIPLIRKINESLPVSRRLRMLAGEPPLDFTSVTSDSQAAAWRRDRDSSLAAVMSREVLAKKRKALLLYGTGHLAHGIEDMAVWQYEKQFPNVTLVLTNSGCYGWPNQNEAFVRAMRELEKRMAGWPVPSLARIRDTWIADLIDPVSSIGIISSRLPPWSTSFDGLLYFGSSELLLFEPTPAYKLLDGPFMAEQRRRAQWGAEAANQVDPEKLLARESNPFFCQEGVGGRYDSR
jgi:hypothetical protein